MYYTKEDIDNIGFEVIEKIFKRKLTSLGLSISEPQLDISMGYYGLMKYMELQKKD